MIYDFEKNVPQIDPDSWVASNAVIIGKVKLEKNSSIWFQAVLRGDTEKITIGENSNVQDGSVLHTDPGFPLTIGKGVTIGHGVMLHGCTISDDTLIGIGCNILNGAKIGKNCIIGAHSLIPENKVIPDNSLVFGSPGRVARKITSEDVVKIKENAKEYIDLMKKYKR